MPTPGRMLTRCCDDAGFELDSGIAYPLSIIQWDKIIRREHRRMIAMRAEQLPCDKLHHVSVDSVAKRLKSPRGHFRKVLQFMKALQTGTLARRHIAPFPSNDRNLGR